MNSKRGFVVKFSFFYSIKDELLSIKQKKNNKQKKYCKKQKKERVFWVTINQVKQLRKIYQKYFT